MKIQLLNDYFSAFSKFFDRAVERANSRNVAYSSGWTGPFSTSTVHRFHKKKD